MSVPLYCHKYNLKVPFSCFFFIPAVVACSQGAPFHWDNHLGHQRPLYYLFLLLKTRRRKKTQQKMKKEKKEEKSISTQRSPPFRSSLARPRSFRLPHSHSNRFQLLPSHKMPRGMHANQTDLIGLNSLWGYTISIMNMLNYHSAMAFGDIV